MIETYKILTGIYDGEVAPTMKFNKDTRTRGNSMKLETSRTRYDTHTHTQVGFTAVSHDSHE
jgi:hypothetical protein